VTVELRRVCACEAEARALVAAVRADTPDFVRLRADGAAVEIGVTARSAASARATLEDLLACLRAAERSAEAAGGPTKDAGERTAK
jgi:hypothetical protein